MRGEHGEPAVVVYAMDDGAWRRRDADARVAALLLIQRWWRSAVRRSRCRACDICTGYGGEVCISCGQWVCSGCWVGHDDEDGEACERGRPDWKEPGAAESPWLDTPKHLACGGPLVAYDHDDESPVPAGLLRCTACGRYSEATAEQRTQAEAADAAWREHQKGGAT